MKKIIFTLLLCSIATVLFAQEDLLIRKWKIDKIASKKILDYGQKLIDNPALMDEETPEDIVREEDALQQLIDNGSYIEIQKKEVFIFGYYNFIADAIVPIKTLWSYLDSDKKSFNIAAQKVEKVVKNKRGVKVTARSSVDYTVFEIYKLTETELILFNTKDEALFTLSPMKK